MNGIHDMGGMHGMGPIQYEKNEPVYHAEWESRVDAMTVALRGKVPGGLRQGIEQLLAADYLRMSYYERWYESLVWRLISAKVATRAEIESGRSAEPRAASTSAYSATEAVALLSLNRSARRDISLAARFQVGQQVRARNINPVGHTRLPRYAREAEWVLLTNFGAFFLFPTLVQEESRKTCIRSVFPHGNFGVSN